MGGGGGGGGGGGLICLLFGLLKIDASPMAIKQDKLRVLHWGFLNPVQVVEIIS